MHHAVFGECASLKASRGVHKWCASAFVLWQHVASDSLLELVTYYSAAAQYCEGMCYRPRRTLRLLLNQL
jgi:hypothetical protein